MAADRAATGPIRFGVFELDLRSGELRKQGVRVRLADQPLSVLAMLLEQPGEVVTRDALRNRLWAADTFVDFDQGLNKAINRVRDVLGDSADSPRFIETLPKRGYRFIGAVTAPLAARPSLATPVPMSTPASPAEPAPTWSPPPSKRSSGRYAPLLAAAVVVAALSLAGAWWIAARSGSGVGPPAPIVRSSILPPPGTSFVPYCLALSADGTHLAFVAETTDGVRSLWIRALSETTARPLAGTAGASLPFWSPDERSIGFFAERRLKIIDITGGAVRVLADARRPSGGSWNAEGVIVFAPDVNGPLMRVPATGGAATAATRLESPPRERQGHRWPVFLPDGRHFLHVALSDLGTREDDLEVRLGSLDSGDSTAIPGLRARGLAASRDHVFAARHGVLRAYPIDVAGNRVGTPVVVPGADVAGPPTFYPSAFAVSGNGVLVFQSAADRTSELMWLAADGRELGPLPSLAYADPTFSPDRTRLAGACEGATVGTTAICVYDLARHVGTRITTGPADRYPLWSPDGRVIAYASSTGTWRVAADGTGPPSAVATLGTPTDWTHDGHLLSFGSRAGTVSLALTSLDTGALTELWPGAEGRLSPDGRWLAYIAPEGLVVVPYPAFSPRVQVAGWGMAQPRWSHDGRRLFYVAPDRKLMAVDFTASSATATAGTPRVVAQTRIVGTSLTMFQYDVAADGRVLINAMPRDAAPLTVLTGWTAALR